MFNIEIQIILPGKLFCLLWNVKILQMITQALQMAKPSSYTMQSCGPLEVPPWLTILVSHYLWFNRFCWEALLRGGKFARTTRFFICQGGHFVRSGKVCKWRRHELRFTWAEDFRQPRRPHTEEKKVPPTRKESQELWDGPLQLAAEDTPRLIIPLRSESVLHPVPQDICTWEDCGQPSITSSWLVKVVASSWWEKT